MSTAIFNRKSIQAGAGHVFLVPTPTEVTATEVDDIVKELLEHFFVDGDKRDTLKPGVKPWAVQGKEGFKTKVDQKPLKDEDNLDPEYILGMQETGYTADFVMKDNDAAHLIDLLSAQGAQIIETPASATQVGRTTVLGGSQRDVNSYMLLFRYESREYPGSFRIICIPACTLTIDGDTQYSKDKPVERKVKVTAQASDLLLDPNTFRNVLWFEDYVKAAKTA